MFRPHDFSEQLDQINAEPNQLQEYDNLAKELRFNPNFSKRKC